MHQKGIQLFWLLVRIVYENSFVIRTFWRRKILNKKLYSVLHSFDLTVNGQKFTVIYIRFMEFRKNPLFFYNNPKSNRWFLILTTIDFFFQFIRTLILNIQLKWSFAEANSIFQNFSNEDSQKPIDFSKCLSLTIEFFL